MPIGQFVRKPVTLYSSTDDQAPQLAATPGSLKTILEACLVSGYGSKQPLGWEMPFSDANSAVFKSQSPDATGCCLQVVNTAPRYVEVRGYHSMTSLTQGVGAFGHQRHRRLLMIHNNESPAWRLVGHDRAFWLFTENLYSPGRSVPLFFGDFPSFAPADHGNCGLLNLWENATYTYLNGSYTGNFFITSSNNGFAAAKSWDGLTPNVTLRASSRCAYFDALPYPDVITGGLQADMMYLHERATPQSTRNLRGRLPGAYYCAHDLGGVAEFAEFNGFDGSDDTFIKVKLDGGGNNGSYHYLINTTAWLA